MLNISAGTILTCLISHLSINFFQKKVLQALILGGIVTLLVGLYINSTISIYKESVDSYSLLIYRHLCALLLCVQGRVGI